MHKAYLKEKNGTKKDSMFENFKSIRSNLSTVIKQAKTNYYEKLFTENQSNIKQTWKEIKKIVNLNKKTSFTPELIRKGDQTITNKQEIANEFNTYFTSIGNSIDQKIPNVDSNFQDYLQNVQTDEKF